MFRVKVVKLYWLTIKIVWNAAQTSMTMILRFQQACLYVKKKKKNEILRIYTYILIKSPYQQNTGMEIF